MCTCGVRSQVGVFFSAAFYLAFFCFYCGVCERECVCMCVCKTRSLTGPRLSVSATLAGSELRDLPVCSLAALRWHTHCHTQFDHSSPSWGIFNSAACIECVSPNCTVSLLVLFESAVTAYPVYANMNTGDINDVCELRRVLRKKKYMKRCLVFKCYI